MPPDREGTRYLIVITLADATPVRLQSVAPALQNLMKGISRTPSELAFHSAARDTLGYFVVSTLSAHQLRTRIATIPEQL